MTRLNLTIESDIGNVPLLAVAVNRISTHLGFDEIQASEIELCIVEAVTNAIQHAYQGRHSHVVTVDIEASTDHLCLSVCDTGTSMSAEQVCRLIGEEASPELDLDNKASLPESGRGLRIIHDLMDDISYTRQGEQNCLLLVKYFAPRQSQLSDDE